MAGSSSRVFAALIPTGNDTFRDENNAGMVTTSQLSTHETKTSGRVVHVTGNCELSGPPDQASLCISVTSSKDSVNDVTNSVSRRLEYILQALRQHEVKEENTTVTKVLRRHNTYDMEAEVSVVFTDFMMMQSISNILVEKLDKTVTVSQPVFSHSTDYLYKLRCQSGMSGKDSQRQRDYFIYSAAKNNLTISLWKRQACLTAVENARHKAREVCGLLGQSLGCPLLVKEEEVREWRGQTEEGARTAGGARASMQEAIRKATVFVSSHVYVSFEIKPKERAKKRH